MPRRAKTSEISPAAQSRERARLEARKSGQQPAARPTVPSFPGKVAPGPKKKPRTSKQLAHDKKLGGEYHGPGRNPGQSLLSRVREVLQESALNKDGTIRRDAKGNI